MVSGLVTSPCDHDMILSGDASEIRIASKSDVKDPRSWKLGLMGSFPGLQALGCWLSARHALTREWPKAQGLRPKAFPILLPAQEPVRPRAPSVSSSSSTTPRPDTATGALGSTR